MELVRNSKSYFAQKLKFYQLNQNKAIRLFKANRQCNILAFQLLVVASNNFRNNYYFANVLETINLFY